MTGKLLHRSEVISSSSAGEAPPIPGEDNPGNDESDLLHNYDSHLICAGGVVLWLWWDFSQFTENLFPTALVNGEEVCGEHISNHVVGYRIDEKKRSETVRMKLQSSGDECKWNGSATCTYRVWVGSGGFDQADAAKRLEKNGTCGTEIKFSIAIDYENGLITIS